MSRQSEITAWHYYKTYLQDMACERVIKTFAGSRSRHCTAQSSGCTVPRSALDCSYTRCQSFTHVPVRQAQDGLD